MEPENKVPPQISTLIKKYKEKLSTFWKNLKKEAGEGLKDVAFTTYPLAIFLMLVYFAAQRAHAGIIRTATVSENHPTIVHVARGRRTAIQFWTKPELVTPGSPGKVQIDFVRDDIEVSPLASDPGNLLVYTRGARFALILQMTPNSSYDDVVKLVPEGLRSGHGLRLDQDTYRATHFKFSISAFGRNEQNVIRALLKNEGRRIEFETLPVPLSNVKHFRCDGCSYVKKPDSAVLDCARQVQEVDCRSSNGITFSMREISE